MDYDYHEAMKLANQLCFPLYAVARNVTNLYYALAETEGTDLHAVYRLSGAFGEGRNIRYRNR